MKILDIYTDASFGGQGKTSEDYYKFKVIGIGIFIIENEKEYSYQYKTNLKYLNEEFFTDNDYIMIEQGEAYGLLKALNFCDNNYDKIHIYTDNIHIYSIINNLSKVSKKDKLLVKIINKCTEKISKLNVNIEIRHIKSHVGVYGNEVADYLATCSKKRKTNICNEQNNISHKVKGIEKYKSVI